MVKRLLGILVVKRFSPHKTRWRRSVWLMAATACLWWWATNIKKSRNLCFNWASSSTRWVSLSWHRAIKDRPICEISLQRTGWRCPWCSYSTRGERFDVWPAWTWKNNNKKVNTLFLDLIGYGFAKVIINSTIMVLKYILELTLTLHGFSGDTFGIAIVAMAYCNYKVWLVSVLFWSDRGKEVLAWH